MGSGTEAGAEGSNTMYLVQLNKFLWNNGHYRRLYVCNIPVINMKIIHKLKFLSPREEIDPCRAQTSNAHRAAMSITASKPLVPPPHLCDIIISNSHHSASIPQSHPLPPGEGSRPLLIPPLKKMLNQTAAATGGRTREALSSHSHLLLRCEQGLNNFSPQRYLLL